MIRLRLLGSVDLVGHDDHPLDTALRRSKLVAVLAYLAAARPQGFHRRDKIAALFWPDLPDDRARNALRVSLSRLRSTLGADAVVTRGADEIGLDRTSFWCDVTALRADLAAGRVVEAAALYHGDFLDGVHVEGTAEELERWIDLERVRIRHEVVQALVATNDVSAARRAVEIAPTDDAVNRHLISLLRDAGDNAQALDAYDNLARRLERDFELAPSDETSRIIADLRDTQRAPKSSPPRGSRVRLSTSRAVIGNPHKPTRTFALGAIALIAVSVAAATVYRVKGTSAAATQEALHWTPHRNLGGFATPLPRMAAGAVLDSTGGGVLLFGGNLNGQNASSSKLLNDLWRYHGFHDGEMPEWTQIKVEGELPAPRQLFALSYDVAHDRLLLHGGGRGFTSPCSNDTWVLDHATGMGAPPRWKQVSIRGQLPTPRAGMQTSYDAAHRRLIRFGGHDCISTFVREIWVLTFDDSTLSSGQWRELLADSSHAPVGRSAYASFYDAPDNRLFIHGGNASGATMGDLWYLDHANGEGGAPAWHSVKCAGAVPPLSSHASAYDSVTGTWVINGGADSSSTETRDTWRVTGLHRATPECRWQLVAVSGPAPNARLGHSAMFDPVGGTLVIEGGEYQGSSFRDVQMLRGAFRR
jgi:DNA-binding SARP family transcriptional activator